MVFQPFLAIQFFRPEVKPKNLRPFMKNEMTVLQILYVKTFTLKVSPRCRPSSGDPSDARPEILRPDL